MTILGVARQLGGYLIIGASLQGDVIIGASLEGDLIIGASPEADLILGASLEPKSNPIVGIPEHRLPRHRDEVPRF